MRNRFRDSPFKHTRSTLYIVTLFSILAIFYDSTQTIIQRYHINKKWFYLYGATCFFAYLYLRPLIRRRLGSAGAGYINWTTIYILWLLAAVFYHTPSLDSLGFDVKADISILLSIFLISMVVLASLYITHWTLVTLKLLNPLLQKSSTHVSQIWALVILNSLNLAIACSSFYSFCGNAYKPNTTNNDDASAPLDGVREAICGNLLRPIPSYKHRIFSSWVIYGEEAAGSARGEPEVISPVFTMWLTIFLVFASNCIADYLAAAVIYDPSIEEAYRTSRIRRSAATSRRTTSEHTRVNRGRDAPRRKSADFVRDMSRFGSTEMLLSFLPGGPDSYIPMAGRASVDAILRTVSSFGSAWSPVSTTDQQHKSMMFRDDSNPTLAQQATYKYAEEGSSQQQSMLSPVPAMVAFDSPSPGASFLPMFPWYSGTQADLWKTVFDLLVSVKLFLGRFDVRTMQAAVAGATEGGQGPPRDGDGVTFEHLAKEEEVVVDFFADTGDGGDSTYSVARCMAAHQITVEVPEQFRDQLGGVKTKTLPRAHTIVHGGDLAYPSPSDETYEQRFFGPYECAMPPPSHVHPGHLVLNKPDLPEQYWRQEVPCTCPAAHALQSREGRCKVCQKAAAVTAYDGPKVYLIPGNHDNHDGLECFQRHIIHKGWLGGWLMPQERSYFALRLPKGWWILAVDLALVDDIDMMQYRYFANVAEERMAPGDAAIVISHAPNWLLGFYWGYDKAKNLRQLIRGPLRGRVRVQLAGDLHFTMRHSFQSYHTDGPPSLAPSERSTPAGGSPDGGSPRASSHSATPPLGNNYPSSSSSSSTATFAKTVAERLATVSGGASPPPAAGETRHNNKYFGGANSPPGSPPMTLPRSNSLGIINGGSPTATAWWPSLKVNTNDQTIHEDQRGCLPPGWMLNEAEHLIVCGAGGAFLHPTHVFSSSRFRPIHDPAAGPVFIQKHRQQLEEGFRRSHPSNSSLYSLSHADDRGPLGGEYRCMSAFPSPETSLKLGQSNLHMFRNVNNRFDVIGGALYYLLVISALPRCTGISAVLDAHSPGEALCTFVQVGIDTLVEILSDSYISCAALAFLFLICLSFAIGGGVGVVRPNGEGGGHYGPPHSKRKPEQHGFVPAVKARTGGSLAQIVFGGLHCALHLTAAISLLLLLELGIELVVRYDGLGKDGYHSLYHWYRQFESEHFPDPAGLRGRVSTWTLSLYPSVLKWVFAVFDVPESIAVSRSVMCASGAAALTRLQTIGYYSGVLLYFWLLATPTVGFFFGLYLYISINWFHVHYDEAFSSLQVPDYKGFLRLHINQKGDLEVYMLGMDQVPKAWREDPRYQTSKGGSNRELPSHKAAYPSRWIPVDEHRASKGGEGWGLIKTTPLPEERLKLVDYVCVQRRA